MKSKRLMNAIGGIEDKYIEAAQPAHKASCTTASKKELYRVWKVALIAASLALVVALAAVFGSNPSWFNNSGNNGVAVAPDKTSQTSDNTTQSNSAVQAEDGYPVDTSMRGLPVENFNLANIQEDDVNMDRMVFSDFGSFFEWGVDSFAVVKVGNIQTVKDDEGSSFERQISNVRIIKSLYGDWQPETLQISQSVIKNHCCLGTTSLLREGAVYILPLKQCNDYWCVFGDMDVLFEVDDKGKVWSHSDYEDFNRYDGKDAEYFVSEFQKLISNDDFLLANSPFSNTLHSWTLADITVIAKSDSLPNEHGQYYNYSFTVNEVLSEPANQNSDQLGATGNIMVYADEDSTIKLTPANRYLIYLDCFDGKININPRMIAEIKDNGTIKAIPADDSNSYLGESVFTPYDGYKISEIKDLISIIHSWQESNR